MWQGASNPGKDTLTFPATLTSSETISNRGEITMLTSSRLRELLHYDPLTGLFTRLVSRSGRSAKKGVTAGWLHCRGYIHISVDSKDYKAHRLAFLYMEGVLPRTRCKPQR